MVALGKRKLRSAESRLLQPEHVDQQKPMKPALKKQRVLGAPASLATKIRVWERVRGGAKVEVIAAEIGKPLNTVKNWPQQVQKVVDRRGEAYVRAQANLRSRARFSESECV
jgi:hypothetical protein